MEEGWRRIWSQTGGPVSTCQPHRSPWECLLLIPQFLTRGHSSLWGSTSYFWRIIGAYHFISFWKVPTSIELWLMSQALTLRIKDYSILLSRKKRKGIHPTCFHSYHQSNFQKGLSLSCLGWHRAKPLVKSQVCPGCLGKWRDRWPLSVAMLQPS